MNKIEMIKTKKRFIKLIIDMEYPVLYYGSSDDYLQLNMFFLIRDDNDRNKRFNLPGCLISSGNVTEQNLQKYYNREKKLLIKYEKWMYEVCGNYCYSLIRELKE